MIGFDSDVYVCNLIGQEKAKGAPPVNYKAMKKAIKKLAAFVDKTHASIHFSKLHPSTPNLDWEKIEKILTDKIISKGQRLFV